MYLTISDLSRYMTSKSENGPVEEKIIFESAESLSLGQLRRQGDRVIFLQSS